MKKIRFSHFFQIFRPKFFFPKKIFFGQKKIFGPKMAKKNFLGQKSQKVFLAKNGKKKIFGPKMAKKIFFPKKKFCQKEFFGAENG